MSMKSWGLCLVALVVCASAEAATWRAARDQSGCLWARVKIVNDSDADSNWIIGNCRTAVSSTSAAANTDAQADWDGVAEANSTEYVWVYGYGIGDVVFQNADGGASAFTGTGTVDEAGDGEIVITITANGAAAAEVVAAEAYGAPSQAGTMPANE